MTAHCTRGACLVRLGGEDELEAAGLLSPQLVQTVGGESVRSHPEFCCDEDLQMSLALLYVQDFQTPMGLGRTLSGCGFCMVF